MKSRLLPVLSMSAAAALITVSLVGNAVSQEGKPPVTAKKGKEAAKVAAVTADAGKKEKVKPFTLECKGEGSASERKEANPEARLAAQKGLNFLAKNTDAWQKQHKCFGCHVQAVTLEAFAVGRHHQYEVKDASYKVALDGLTTIPGGTRTGSGLRYAHGDSLQAPSKAFGGAALGRHDQWVAQDAREDLLETAKQLLAYQQDDGLVKLDWTNPPVGVGSVQGAYQSIQTWQQSYARTADPRWLTAAQKSEAFLQRTIDGWYKTKPQHIQEVNYAILGLLAAGVGTEEESLKMLRELLLKLQNEDGGWGFNINESVKEAKPRGEQEGWNIFPGKFNQMVSDGKSNPFATGQTLYTLRMMGMSDSDKSIQKGTKWLMEKQKTDGGWSAAGFGKAEAMWGVLGLVSLDVLSLKVVGITRGMHIEDKLMFGVEAWDNSGAKVVKIEFAVDDIPVHAVCGDDMGHTFDASGLEEGKHILDVRAVNDRGEVSSRRFEVYAGDIYLTQLGSSFTDGGTMISLRNIAPKKLENSVKLEVYSTKEVDGVAKTNKKLRAMGSKGTQGAMTFFWDGKDAKGKASKAGEKYIARLTFIDKDGKTRQTEELEFVHDSYEAQRARYAEVGGQLQFGDDQMAGVANTEVELVDEAGNVVQSTRSTAAGNYRFRNADKKKKYRVRVKKKGYKTQEKRVKDFDDEEKAAEGEADFKL